MKVCTIIPTYRRKKHIASILKQIQEQPIENIDLKVIVIVNDLKDGSIEAIYESKLDVDIIKGNPGWWFTTSVNEGCKRAIRYDPDLLLFLNDDIILSKNYLQTLIDTYKSIDKACILGSISFNTENNPLLTFSGIRHISRWNLKYKSYCKTYTPMQEINLNGVYKSLALPTRGLLCDFAIAKSLNFFDEKFPQYGSDYDFTLRAAKMDIPVYISWESILYENEKLTGSSSLKNQISLIKYYKSMFNKYSPNSLEKNIRMLWRHGNKALFLLGFLYLLIGSFKTYLTYFKKWKN